MKPTSDDEFVNLNHTINDCLMKYLEGKVHLDIQKQLAGALLEIFQVNLVSSAEFSSSGENKNKDIRVTTGPAYVSTTSTKEPEQLEFILKYENELF